MEGIDFQTILFYLGPTSGELIWNILLYFIFFFALITMLVMPDKNLVATLLISAVLMTTVIAKLSLSARPPIIRADDFLMYVLNVSTFVFPLLVAGIVRAKKKGKVVPAAITTAFFGGVYFFLFWFFVQRGA
ncbi:MAG TPA: hypothetical protein VK003_18425 [Oceanobacillus sp.]|jgi:1,4-dihydroxy-2-naphthoate octaprenyltransferase|nr:hypothetical protein [Oceanobacillus sp.]